MPIEPLRVGVASLLEKYRGRRVLYLPNPGNAGDSLIAVGTLSAFRAAGILAEPIDAAADVRGEVVILGGGGNFIPLYRAIRYAFERFRGKAEEILLLPHTIRGNEDILCDLDESCTLICREEESLRHVRRHARRANILLGHDMAFHLDAAAFLRSGRVALEAMPTFLDRVRLEPSLASRLRGGETLRVFRGDAEARIRGRPGDGDLSQIFALGVQSGQAEVAAWCFLNAASLAACVETDRLHVGIACALLGVPCRLYDNSYGKNRAVFAHSLRNFSNKIEFLE